LLKVLEDFEEIPLVVLDIDGPAFAKFFQMHHFVSHGWGEILWLLDGHLMAAIGGKSKTEGQMVENMRLLREKSGSASD
jgi:hypothetical protein